MSDSTSRVPGMPLSAWHSQWNKRVDASDHSEDGNEVWAKLHRNRAETRFLRCRVCEQAMTAAVSHRGVRYFRHLPDGAGECPTSGESMEHQELKAWIARWGHESGWRVEVERRAEDGSYRADVMTTSPDGSRTVVWEAQVSRLDDVAAFERTRRHVEAGNEIVWVCLSDQSWTERLPTLSIRRRDDEVQPYVVTKGLSVLDRKRLAQNYRRHTAKFLAEDCDPFRPSALDLAPDLWQGAWLRSQAWQEWPTLLGFDLGGLAKHDPQPGCRPVSLGAWVAQMRWALPDTEVTLGGFVSSLLRGGTVCVRRLRNVHQYLGTGLHPAFLWIPSRELLEAAAITAAMLSGSQDGAVQAALSGRLGA